MHISPPPSFTLWSSNCLRPLHRPPWSRSRLAVGAVCFICMWVFSCGKMVNSRTQRKISTQGSGGRSFCVLGHLILWAQESEPFPLLRFFLLPPGSPSLRASSYSCWLVLSLPASPDVCGFSSAIESSQVRVSHSIYTCWHQPFAKPEDVLLCWHANTRLIAFKLIK